MNDISLENAWKIVLAVLIVGLLSFAGYKAVTYRKSENITVGSRYWQYYAAVKWDTHYTETHTYVTCSMVGKSTVCIPHTTIVTHTVVHTRCENTTHGADLPPVRPDLCQMQGGDYLSEDVTYHITYRDYKTEKPGEKRIAREQWDNLPPKAKRTITSNILGWVIDAKPIEGKQ